MTAYNSTPTVARIILTTDDVCKDGGKREISQRTLLFDNPEKAQKFVKDFGTATVPYGDDGDTGILSVVIDERVQSAKDDLLDYLING